MLRRVAAIMHSGHVNLLCIVVIIRRGHADLLIRGFVAIHLLIRGDVVIHRVVVIMHRGHANLLIHGFVAVHGVLAIVRRGHANLLIEVEAQQLNEDENLARTWRASRPITMGRHANKRVSPEEKPGASRSTFNRTHSYPERRADAVCYPSDLPAPATQMSQTSKTNKT